MPLSALQAGDPTQVGEYRLTARLGAGGMGVVFLGSTPHAAGGSAAAEPPAARPSPSGSHRPSDARPAHELVAVKLIHRRIANHPDYRARFRREVVAARAVDGTCTARVLAADPDADRPWLATEYVPGPSLTEAVAVAGSLPEPTVRALAVGLAEALVAIHRAGVVHRDLKPSNVLVTEAGPRVIDFGMAVPAGPGFAGPPGGSPTAGAAAEGQGGAGLGLGVGAPPDGLDVGEVTRTGSIVGSPGYLAPEQISGVAVGPPADVWAWALTVAFASTGRAPFGSGPAEVLIYRTLYRNADLDGVPPDLRRVIRSALQQDPAARPSADALLAALVPDGADPVEATVRILDQLWRPPVAASPAAHDLIRPTRPEPVGFGADQHGTARWDTTPDGLGGAPGYPSTHRHPWADPPPDAPGGYPAAGAYQDPGNAGRGYAEVQGGYGQGYAQRQQYPSQGGYAPGAPGAPGAAEAAEAAGGYPGAHRPAGYPPAQDGVPAWDGRGPRRRPWLVPGFAAALVAAAVGGGLAVALTRGSGADVGPTPTTSPTVSVSTPVPAVSSAVAVPPGSSTAPPAANVAVVGKWWGGYECRQGRTGLTLTVTSPAPGELAALFAFSPLPQNPTVPTGSYTMTGSYRAGRLELNGERWVVQPAGYLMVGLSGTYAAGPPEILSGRVTDPSCTTFSLQRSP